MTRIVTPLLAYFLTASLAFASYVHVTLDSNTREDPETIAGVFSANTPMFKATLLDNAVGINLGGTTSRVYFYYAVLPVTGSYARITGTYTTNLVTFTGTNDFPSSGDYEWAVVREWNQTTTYTNVVTYGQGTMKVKRSGAAGATTVAVLRSTVNWNTINMVGTPPWSTTVGNITNIYRSGGIPITITSPYGPNVGMNISTSTIQTATKANVNAGGLTGTVANARLDADLQKFAVNDMSSGTNLNTSGNWTGTWQTYAASFFRNGPNVTGTVSLADQLDAQHGSYYRDYANITNHGVFLTAESDTLQTVANRGATATNKVTLSGGVSTPAITNSGNTMINPAGGVWLGRSLPSSNRGNTGTFCFAKMNVDVTAPADWNGAGGGGITNLGGLWMYSGSPIKLGGVSRTTWPSTNGLASTNWVLQQSYVTGPWVIAQAYHNIGAATGNVPVVVEQTIDHGNLLGLTDTADHAYAVRTNDNRAVNLTGAALTVATATAATHPTTLAQMNSSNALYYPKAGGTLSGTMNGGAREITNAYIRALSLHVQGGATNNGVFRFNSTLSMNGTNAYVIRTQNVTGTNWAFFNFNGTNRNFLRLE